MHWIPAAGLVLATIAAVWAALASFGARRWAIATGELCARLEAARLSPPATAYDPREIEGLPAPVQRFFRTALEAGQPIVAATRVAHAGRFNLGEAAERWVPFTSAQCVVTHRPGFVWDARIAVAPGIAVRVHDAYVAGEGLLHAAALGLFTVADLRGGGEVARGEFMRCFAEAAWYPTALLPSQGVRWSGIDARSALATIRDGGESVSLAFTFGDDGLVQSVRAEARERLLGATAVPTPWEGRWTDYRQHDGMRIPYTGEVAWLLPQGRQPYWRGTITALALETAN
jgi:hypothetical protein